VAETVELVFTDDELAEQALAADPDAALADDAVPFQPASATGELLPSWYMPAAVTAGDPATRGRRKVVASTITVALLAVNALGLCVTDGVLEIPFF
jgi:hypothetical protein